MECYGLSLRIPAYNGITHYFIALCGHKQFNVMLRTLAIIFDFIPGEAPFLLLRFFYTVECTTYKAVTLVEHNGAFVFNAALGKIERNIFSVETSDPRRLVVV